MKIVIFILVVIGVIIGLLYCTIVIPYQQIQSSHLQQTKQVLLKLVNNRATLNKRIADIKKHEKDYWTDGRVGIIADGYVFVYDLHASHGNDAIADVNILYLPDERRFIVNHKHFCIDMGKTIQPKNKSQLLTTFDSGI